MFVKIVDPNEEFPIDYLDGAILKVGRITIVNREENKVEGILDPTATEEPISTGVESVVDTPESEEVATVSTVADRVTRFSAAIDVPEGENACTDFHVDLWFTDNGQEKHRRKSFPENAPFDEILESMKTYEDWDE